MITPSSSVTPAQGAAKLAAVPSPAAQPNPDFDLRLDGSEGAGRAKTVPPSRRSADLRKQLDLVRSRVGEVNLRKDALTQVDSKTALAKAKKTQALESCKAEINLLQNLYQHYANELVDAEAEQAEVDAVERIASGDTVPVIKSGSK